MPQRWGSRFEHAGGDRGVAVSVRRGLAVCVSLALILAVDAAAGTAPVPMRTGDFYATIYGTVYDASGPEPRPLEGAVVALGATVAVADADGRYSIHTVLHDTDRVTVSAEAEGFDGDAVEDRALSLVQSLPLDFYLYPEGSPRPTVTSPPPRTPTRTPTSIAARSPTPTRTPDLFQQLGIRSIRVEVYDGRYESRPLIPDADVRYEQGRDGQVIRTGYLSSGDRGSFPLFLKWQAGDTFTVYAEAPGYQPAIARGYVPDENYNFVSYLPLVPPGATPLPTHSPWLCWGDCDGNGFTSQSELQVGVEIALRRLRVETCAELDPNRDRKITVDELVRAVAVRSCLFVPSQTPTPRPTAIPSCAGSSLPRPVDTTGCVADFAEYPHLLWFEDHGDLIGGSSEWHHYLKDGLVQRLAERCGAEDFDLMVAFTSNLDARITGSAGGGVEYLPICQSEAGGLVLGFQRRPCTVVDTIEGIAAMLHLDIWLDSAERPSTLLHELGHRWGALAKTSTPSTNIGLHHWSSVYKGPIDYLEIQSPMGGYPPEYLRFALLDLYLMGLADPSEVPPYNYIDNAGEPIPVTIESIIEATGQRVPAYPEAQSHFRVAFVVMTPEGTTPRPCEMELAEHWAERLPAWWQHATRERGSIDTRLHAPP